MGLTGALLFIAALLLAIPGLAQQPYITLASTTSTEQSGLFRHLLPIFEKKAGIQVRVVALGTGQALDMGRRGDADVVFVHAQPLEEEFVADGHGVRRFPIMYNEFVLVGPRSDPAEVGAARDIVAALRQIKAARAPFASRGDRSGTHFAELELWKAAGVDIARDKGRWYRDTGSGMGATLNIASGLSAYALADRASWLSFRNRGELTILIEGDQRLFNQYGAILVNPARHPHVKEQMGQVFIDWLISPGGQDAIAGYRIHGEQAFFPNAPS